MQRGLDPPLCPSLFLSLHWARAGVCTQSQTGYVTFWYLPSAWFMTVWVGSQHTGESHGSWALLGRADLLVACDGPKYLHWLDPTLMLLSCHYEHCVNHKWWACTIKHRMCRALQLDGGHGSLWNVASGSFLSWTYFRNPSSFMTLVLSKWVGLRICLKLRLGF